MAVFGEGHAEAQCEYPGCPLPRYKHEHKKHESQEALAGLIAYPVRIRDANNRVIAAGLIGRDADEIVRVLNLWASKRESV